MNGPLISDQYRALNKELHNRNAKYGGKGDPWADRVILYMNQAEANSYLDYGCGKKQLLRAIQDRRSEWGFPYLGGKHGILSAVGYDPVTAPETPEPADFVTCNDVLEHIEPEYLDNVLADIASKINKRGLLVISQRLANKRLADGRNAHLIVEKTEWWVARLAKHFREIIEVEPIKPARVGVELAVLVRPWRTQDQEFDGGPLVQLIQR